MSRHQFSRTLEGHCTAGAAGTASTGNAWCSGLSSAATTSSDLSWLDHVLLFEKAEFFLWPCGWKVQVTMGQAQIANQMGAYYRLMILVLSNDVHLLGLSFAGPSMRPWCLYIWLIFFLKIHSWLVASIAVAVVKWPGKCPWNRGRPGCACRWYGWLWRLLWTDGHSSWTGRSSMRKQLLLCVWKETHWGCFFLQKLWHLETYTNFCAVSTWCFFAGNYILD